MDVKQLKANIQNFRLDDGDRGNQGYERVLLQLFGYLGHGKSSFINSCKYVLEDGEHFIEHALARDTDHGLTMSRDAFELTNVITIVDNRGCSKMDDFERAEVYAQLGNFIPVGQKVNWKDNFKAMMEELENADLQPNFTDFIVPILVYSVRQRIPDGEMEGVKTFLNTCVQMTGVVPIIVLTFKNRGDCLEIERKFRLMGAEEVIAVENYTLENHVKTTGRTTDILMVINSALRNVKFRLEQPRDPKMDRLSRKKFLLNYVHQTCVNQEREKREILEKKREDERRARENSFLFQIIRLIFPSAYFTLSIFRRSLKTHLFREAYRPLHNT